MRISKKKAIEFAIYEEKHRRCGEGTCTPIKEYVMNEDTWEPWVFNAPSMIATMICDGVFDFYDRQQVAKVSRKFGKKLWDAAIVSYLTGDFDS